MAKKIKIELTTLEMEAILNIVTSIESMLGCAEPDENGNSWDTDMIKSIKKIDYMLKRNGYKRTN